MTNQLTDFSPFLPDDNDEENMVRLYTTKNCTKCPQVRAWLAKNDVEYDEVDMSSGKWLADLRMCGVFVMSAPVLYMGNRFYTPDELFTDGQLRNLDHLLKEE